MIRLRTWHLELLAVALVLALGVLAGGSILAWAAVLLTFAHAQVADRLQEGASKGQDIECRWKLDYYLVAKEVLWLTYFVSERSWPAAMGAVLFAVYPMWRRWWRARRSGAP